MTVTIPAEMIDFWRSEYSIFRILYFVAAHVTFSHWKVETLSKCINDRVKAQAQSQAQSQAQTQSETSLLKNRKGNLDGTWKLHRYPIGTSTSVTG